MTPLYKFKAATIMILDDCDTGFQVCPVREGNAWLLSGDQGMCRPIPNVAAYPSVVGVGASMS